MPSESLFTIDGKLATPVDTITLAEAGLRERRDLQEWILAHPEILGEDLVIVTFEFDRWRASAANPSDRLDVLALGSDGRLVVAELKRDRAPDTVEMQVIKYAAMASRFTQETLAEQHSRFLTSRGAATSDEEALRLLESHAGGPLDPEMLRRPRIVVLAGSFPPVITATAVWLNEMGVDFTLIQVRVYRTAHDILISTSQLYPVKDIEDFTISPRQAEAKAVDEKLQRQRDASTTRRLVEAGLLEDGIILKLKPVGINDDLQTRLSVWLETNPRSDIAEWTNTTASPLKWGYDGQPYTPSGLAGVILQRATGVSRSIRGGQWWITDDGRSLVEIAQELGSEREHLYLGFWTRFAERLTTLHPDWIATRGTPGRSSWFDMASELPSMHYSAAFMREPHIKYEVYLDAGNPDKNRQLFEPLLKQQKKIDAAYGQPLDWRPPHARHRHAAIVALGQGRITDIDHYEEVMDWFIETGEKLRDAVRSVLGKA